MQCPSCGNALSEVAAVGVKSHACAGGCGGLWLRILEVRKLRERLPGQGAPLLFVERAEGVRLFRNPEHPCPHCQTTLLYRHCFSRKQEIEIDQCSKCGGYWIDPGRLGKLGDAKLDEEKKKELAREFFAELFDQRVKNMNLVNHDTLESAKEVVRIFRFITPVAYAPATPPLELD